MEQRTPPERPAPKEVKNPIGEGAFSTVVMAVDRSRADGVVAAKIYNTEKMNSFEREALRKEVEILRSLDHPNIVKLRDVFQTRRRVYLVMEYLSGGELMQRVRSRQVMGEPEAAHVVGGVLEAVKYLHSRHIVHRDLKLENIVYESSAPGSPVKLTDFGFAKMMDAKGVLDTPCGSPLYVAPEIVREEPYDQSIDMWSAGVVLYTLLCGYPPFYDDDERKVMEMIVHGEFAWPDPRVVPLSESVRHLVSSLLRVVPSERLSAETALQHRWFRETLQPSPRGKSPLPRGGSPDRAAGCSSQAESSPIVECAQSSGPAKKLKIECGSGSGSGGSKNREKRAKTRRMLLKRSTSSSLSGGASDGDKQAREPAAGKPPPAM
eukprot:m51a1_g13972 putative calcium calmodulin-dependent protein kinase type 1 (378) ;mRNA; f:990234-991990